jgi:hypothetical protein
MKATKILMLIFSMLIFIAAGSSGSPGEKMTFKPGIAFSAGQMDVQVMVAPQEVSMDMIYTYQSYIPNSFEVRKNRFVDLFDEADRAFDKAFNDYLITTKGRHVDKTLIINNAFTYGSGTGYLTNKFNDGYRYLNYCKFPSRYERRHI